MEEGLNFEGLPELMKFRNGNTAVNYSPLVLAYMGDAVYELMIRTQIISMGNRPVNDLHHRTVQFVKAETQAKLIRAMEPLLTDEERAVFKRGRNAHSNTAAKNASIIDYRMATGFEALVGWLWLTGRTERLSVLLKEAFGKIGRNPAKGRKKAEDSEPSEQEAAAGETATIIAEIAGNVKSSTENRNSQEKDYE